MTKCVKSLLQNALGFLLQIATVLLQNATVITNCDDFITKCNVYYKLRQYSQHWPIKISAQTRKIYKGVCSCSEGYIGKTIRNVEVRWDEHNNPLKKSNQSKHIKDNLNHVLICQCTYKLYFLIVLVRLLFYALMMV